MILLTLSRGNEHERVHLRLPASPAEIGEAFVILDGISLDTTTTAMATGWQAVIWRSSPRRLRWSA